MERIMIIGCGGSGKSTLARQLGQKLNMPVVHLDQLWWLPGWVERDRESFDALLAQQLLNAYMWYMTITGDGDLTDNNFKPDYEMSDGLWNMLKQAAMTIYNAEEQKSKTGLLCNPVFGLFMLKKYGLYVNLCIASMELSVVSYKIS